ncbi:MAG: glycosyltransferase [Acidobacteria bacterium]|nr:glycosyltransferase [Acidobacteriota bacterium]
MLHAARTAETLPMQVRLRPNPSIVIGDSLLTEARSRADIDVVCTLSPFDRDLEQWIGAKRTAWLPRVIAGKPLDWRPTGDRVGLVGTLDHAPNLEGLIMVLDSLAQRHGAQLRVRLVGGPTQMGRWIAAKYPAVDYLGPLGDRELADEASSWNAFIHPLFCRARGCSTKLATAIGWHIPVVTTTVGHRGYEWREGHFAVADDPSSFVDACLRLLSRDAADTARRGIVDVANSSPTVPDVAERLRSLLESLGGQTSGSRARRDVPSF